MHGVLAATALNRASAHKAKHVTPFALLGLVEAEEVEEEEEEKAEEKQPRVGLLAMVSAACGLLMAPWTHLFQRDTQGLRAYSSYEAVEIDDERRMTMLALSRESDLVFGLGLLTDPKRILSTVVPRLIIAPTTLLTIASFGVAAFLARSGVIGLAVEDYDESAMDGASVLISFLISFYLGYCYNRYYAIYWACMDCRNHVMECCALARLYLYDTEDVWRIWRYANLAHVSAMIGLSPVYTVDNLFKPFVREQGLFAFGEEPPSPRAAAESRAKPPKPPPPVRDPEHAQELKEILAGNMDRTGLRVSQTCIGWALGVVSRARASGRLEKPEVRPR